MRSTGRSYLLVFALTALVGAACSAKRQPPADGDAAGSDRSVSFADTGGGENGCVGLGCACTTDDPCVLGADGTICKDRRCQLGCNGVVPCTDGATCCQGQCVSGCCTTSDCPPGKLCEPATRKCGSCTTADECGGGARCCGAVDEQSCFLGNCCVDEDCDTQVERCVGHICRRSCDAKARCAAGFACCGGSCYAGACCTTGDCQGGLVCRNNSCVACLNASECGTGKICKDGDCVAGCSGEASCGGAAVCCGLSGRCDPGQAGCEGSCFAGNCCGDRDCAGAGERCAADSRCRKVCKADSECGGGFCCGGFCHGEACVDTIVRGPLGAPDSVVATARVNGIRGLALDGKDNPFFTEWLSGVVRVANLGAEAIGRVKAGEVGRLTGGYFGCKAGPVEEAEMRMPWGLAFDDMGILYVADYGCRVIWRFSKDFSTVEILAGDPNASDESKDGQGSGAHFRPIRGLVFGPDKKLYVAGYVASVIRQVALDGTVTTVAGQAGARTETDGAALSGARFDYPSGLAMDSGGTLFVSDYEAGTVRKVSNLAAGTAVRVDTLSPFDLDLKQAREAYRPDPDPDPRRRYLRTFGYASHGNLVVAGTSLYANFWPNGLWELSPRAGGAWNFQKIYGGRSMITQAIDSGGRFWFGGWVNDGDSTTHANTLQQWDRTKTLRTIGTAGRFGVAGGAKPSFLFANCDAAIAVTNNGDLWLADRCAAQVRRINGVTGVVTNIGSGLWGEAGGTAGAAAFAYPSALVADGSAVLGVNSGGGQKIFRIDSSNTATIVGTYRPQSEAGLHENGTSVLVPNASLPGGIVLDKAQGNLYLTTYSEPGSGRSPAYKYKKGEAGCNAAEGCLTYNDAMPMVIKVPNSGAGAAVWFAGTRNRTGSRNASGLCPDGPLGVGRFGAYPRGLAMDGAGYLYVADSACGVRKVAPDGTLSTLAKDVRGRGIAFAADGKLYADSGDQIFAVDRLSGAATLYAGAGGTSYGEHYRDGALLYAKLWSPWSISADSAGRLYVVDHYNSAIRVIRR